MHMVVVAKTFYTLQGAYVLEANMRILLDNGANIEAKTKGIGQTALHWPTQGGHDAIV